MNALVGAWSGSGIRKAQAHFPTTWDGLVAARDWCVHVLSTKAEPVPDLSGSLHYLVESTANYHMPVCMAWGGDPTIINPMIAGATKRKTDVLDSRLLALHDQLNIWRERYIPSEDVKALRVMISQRDRCRHEATAAGNRINNILTRFGFTVGRDGSVVTDHRIRDTVEGLLSNDVSTAEGLCPIPIPMEVRMVLREEYQKYDRLTAQADECKARIFEKARSMEWETGTGFTYDNYHAIRNIDVFDIPVEELVFINHDFKRYIRILKENGIDTTVDLATAYITCSLGSCRGLGRKFFGLLKDFLDHHVTYRQMYDEIKEKLNKEDFFNEPA